MSNIRHFISIDDCCDHKGYSGDMEHEADPLSLPKAVSKCRGDERRHKGWKDYFLLFYGEFLLDGGEEAIDEAGGNENADKAKFNPYLNGEIMGVEDAVIVVKAAL